MATVRTPESQIRLYEGAQDFEVRIVFEIRNLHCARSLVIVSGACQELAQMR